MSAKAPYYYSELGPDKSPLGAPPPPDEPAGLNGGTPPPGSSASESVAADTSPIGDQGGGFFNPLLSIEPDVSQQRGSSGDYGTLGNKLGRPVVDAHHHHHAHTTWRRVMNEYVEHRSAPGELQGGTLPARASKLHRIPYASHKTFQQPCQSAPAPPLPAGSASVSPYGRAVLPSGSEAGTTPLPEPLYMLYDDTHKRRTTPLLAAAGGHFYRRDTITCEDGYSAAGSELGLDHSESSEEGDTTGRVRRGSRLGSNGNKPGKKRKDSDLTSSFTRFFSTRRKDFDSDKLGSRMGSRQLDPPLTLPPVPPGLTPEQKKRRFIVHNIVESENSYVGTLQRLILDFKRPLMASQPPL
ncbi:hypothetical protein MRX96_059714 [Rhipicephalus microplus]